MTQVLDDVSIGRWRLRAQRLIGPGFASAPAVVAGLLAIQAENHGQAKWAVAARTSGLDEPAFDRLFDRGDILRTHVLRPTWHYVSPHDIRWLLDLTAPRVLRLSDPLRLQLELDDRVLGRAADAVMAALGGGTHLSRASVAAVLQAADISPDGQRLGAILAHLELTASICSGAVLRGEHTYASLDERAPSARRLDRDEALGQLAERYFRGHGPATERDLAYWATMTITDVRTGLAVAADRLERFNHGDRTYWYADSRPVAAGVLSPRGHLLQILDEYYRGYQDSRWHLDAANSLRRAREAATGMALVDGQMVGYMRRRIRGGDLRFEVDAFRTLGTAQTAALEEAADAYARFLRLEASIVVNAVAAQPAG
jgi:hypothetical protein